MKRTPKKLLATLLALAMLASLCVIPAAAAETKAAAIDDTQYDTLQAALSADAAANGTVKLLKDVTEDITIEKDGVTLEGGGNVLNGTVTVKAGGVTINNVKFSGTTTTTKNAVLIKATTSGKFTFTNNTVENLTGFRTLLTLDVGGVATITGNHFENGTGNNESTGNGYNAYNVIEFSQLKDYPTATGTTVSNNTFTEKAFSNNAISLYRLAADAEYTISGNTMAFAANGLRVSNYSSVKPVTFKLSGNTYENTLDGEYAGFIVLQDTDKTNDQNFKDITFDISDLTGPKGSL